MARNLGPEHISGLHRDEMMGAQANCRHCDPWHPHYIDMRSGSEKEAAQKRHLNRMAPDTDEKVDENRLGDYY